MQAKTKAQAAAAAGISERTARRWQDRGLPSQTRKPHCWRTRPDPFAEVFESHVVPLLRADTRGELLATTVLETLRKQDPGRFADDSSLRTLQRRIKQWRALQGPEKEVFFEQKACPGHQASFDLADATDLQIRIGGTPFVHKLFELVLCYSGWRSVTVVRRETFEALLCGVQRGLFAMGGVPQELRSDNLSAAVHNLREKKLGATRRWQAVLDHFGLRHSRIQPGHPHENGVAEQAHRRTLCSLRQTLLVRGSCDFDSVAKYEAFVQEVVEQAQNGPAALCR